ncbi:MAG: MerR family DNA-binding transcriptional regulator [Syntrophobacteria bacterium]|jgi:MerR family mercuric resistance operon transcriptional regulator/MerR family gold-responsive transcriptional activator of gol and ges genes
MMRIGELAKKVGITTQAIRYCERIGLLGKPARTPSGYRVYGQEAVDFLGFVKKAQGLGFNLQEIKTTGRRPCGYVAEQTQKKLQEVEKKIRELREFRRLFLDIQKEWQTLEVFPDQNHTVCPLIEGLEKQQRRS